MRPVFVVGCQRSGSTMLGAMLGGHGRCVCVPESSFLMAAMPHPNGPDSQDPAPIIAAIKSHWSFRAWNLDLESMLPELGEAQPNFRDVVEWLVAHYTTSRKS